MPIYEYRCGSCGHQQEFLQKVSDAPLTVCTRCGEASFTKMLTAAGFQLKGSGWYATDFRNKGSAPAGAAKDGSGKSDAAKGEGAKEQGSGKGESKGDGTSASAAAPACGAGACPACQ